MLNRRTERLAQIIVFVLIMELLMFLIPKLTTEPSKPDIFSYIKLALTYLCGISYCYIRVRNTVFRRKINKYCNRKNYDATINLLNRTIKEQSRIPWLRIQRGIIFGLSGKFDSFREEFNLIYNHEPFCKKRYYKFYLSFIAMSDGLDFINNTFVKMKLPSHINGKPIEKYLKPPFIHIHKAIQAYQNNDMENTIYHASWVYNEDSEFFKLFSSFILMNAYESLGEMEKSIIYKNMYMSNPINSSEFR